MSKDVNKFFVSGRLGRDPELRHPQQGRVVANLSLANSRPVRQPDGSYVEQTEWFKITVWDRLAQTCATYLKKGSSVFFEGRLEITNYQDRAGQTRQKIEVIASDMVMLGGGQPRHHQEEEEEAEEEAEEDHFFSQLEADGGTVLLEEGGQEVAKDEEPYESEGSEPMVASSVVKNTEMADPWENFSAAATSELKPGQAVAAITSSNKAVVTAQPVAATITPSQLSKIRELAEAKGYSVKAVQTSTQKLFSLSLEQLTSQQAAEVIERLERLKEIEPGKAA